MLWLEFWDVSYYAFAFYLGWCHLNNLYYLLPMLSCFDCLRCPVPSFVLLHYIVETIKQVTTKYKNAWCVVIAFEFFCRDAKDFFSIHLLMCIVSFASFAYARQKRVNNNKAERDGNNEWRIFVSSFLCEFNKSHKSNENNKLLHIFTCFNLKKEQLYGKVNDTDICFFQVLYHHYCW